MVSKNYVVDDQKDRDERFHAQFLRCRTLVCADAGYAPPDVWRGRESMTWMDLLLPGLEGDERFRTAVLES